MASDPVFMEKVVDKVFPLEVWARAMFGEFGLYCNGRFFALVCDNTLFIKVTVPGDEIAGLVRRGHPYPGAKPACQISPAKLNDRDRLVGLVATMCDALAQPKPKSQSARVPPPFR